MAEVFFNGSAGRIEGFYTRANNPKAPIALVLHPNPLYAGNMNNNVVYHTYKALVKSGFSVLRINFRGVGRSENKEPKPGAEGLGEMMDASTAFSWLQGEHLEAEYSLIAGFSFGAWIALQLVTRRPEVDNFIAISPPFNKYDFSFLSQFSLSGLIIQGDQDSIVPVESVIEMTKRLEKNKRISIQCKIIDGADHFFRNKLDVLSQTIEDYINAGFTHKKLLKRYQSSQGSADEEYLENDNENTGARKTKVEKVFLE